MKGRDRGMRGEIVEELRILGNEKVGRSQIKK